MTDLTSRQIKQAVLQGLKEVAERFAENPQPTDGTVRAALAAARGKSLPKHKASKRPAAKESRFDCAR